MYQNFFFPKEHKRILISTEINNITYILSFKAHPYQQ